MRSAEKRFLPRGKGVVVAISKISKIVLRRTVYRTKNLIRTVFRPYVDRCLKR